VGYDIDILGTYVTKSWYNTTDNNRCNEGLESTIMGISWGYKMGYTASNMIYCMGVLNIRGYRGTLQKLEFV
jgi:hypothetical protein